MSGVTFHFASEMEKGAHIFNSAFIFKYNLLCVSLRMHVVGCVFITFLTLCEFLLSFNSKCNKNFAKNLNENRNSFKNSNQILTKENKASFEKCLGRVSCLHFNLASPLNPHHATFFCHQKSFSC